MGIVWSYGRLPEYHIPMMFVFMRDAPRSAAAYLVV